MPLACFLSIDTISTNYEVSNKIIKLKIQNVIYAVSSSLANYMHDVNDFDFLQQSVCSPTCTQTNLQVFSSRKKMLVEAHVTQ